jgi:hypothetical protein
MVHSSFEELTYLMSFSWFKIFTSVFGFQGTNMTNIFIGHQKREIFPAFDYR